MSPEQHLQSWRKYLDAIPWAPGSLDGQEYSAFRCAKEHEVDIDLAIREVIARMEATGTTPEPLSAKSPQSAHRERTMAETKAEGEILRAKQKQQSTPGANGDNGDKPPEFQPGHSLIWYARNPINHENTLLGVRYLCRAGGMFVVAPSGLGKSTLSIQMAILWCCGLVAFGIPPRKALRILIVQSEDDEGDCTEMSQVSDHLGLSEAQKELVDKNTDLIRCNDLVGLNFITALRARLQKAKDDGKPFDLVIINPYGVYLGEDVKDTEACTRFLNQWLNPVLSEFNVAAILIHHTAKTNFQSTDKYKIWDWMYHGAGCASITNWARAILAIKPETEDLKIFPFVAAKRGSRIGEEWGGGFERYFAWSSVPGVLRWENATALQIAEATSKARKSVSVDLEKALDAVPPVDPVLKPVAIKNIQAACSVGEKKAKEALNELIVAEKISEVLIPNPNGKRGFAGVRRTA